MIIFQFLLIAAIAYKIKYLRNEYADDYIAPHNTTLILGIMVVIVFFRHFSEQVVVNNFSSQIFMMTEKLIGQLMVGVFLFYSGYGIMTSYMAKGNKYIQTMPYRRILKVLFNFDVAVILFLITNIILGKTYSFGRNALAFIGYESIGNSNWYIFATLVAYIIFYIAFLISKQNYLQGILISTVLFIVYAFLMAIYKEDFWYSTIFCFALGMVYAWKKEEVERWIKGSKHYLTSLLLTVGCTGIFNVLRYVNVVFYIIAACCFCILVVFLSMKFRLYPGNKVLSFLGKHSFSIYILQRIPMNIISASAYSNLSNEIRFCICFISTLFMAVIFDYLVKHVNPFNK